MLNRQRIINKALEAFKLSQGITDNVKSMVIKCDLLPDGRANIFIRINNNIVMRGEKSNFDFVAADLDLPYLFTIDEIERAYTLAANAICNGLKAQGISDQQIHSTDISYQAARPALLCQLMNIEKSRYTGAENE